ncbi:nuclear transport factor 2 family protein [Nonomuraea sp. LPB2021202275-12-8]|uniref:nuclear transport factor 2 family protein n=1 Tax=Nonomuraea sp. LPB2021202275-12-8 TaxID=3120159 RepID=UPI00300D4D63
MSLRPPAQTTGRRSTPGKRGPSPSPGEAPPPRPAGAPGLALAERFAAAVNRGDREAVGALFAEDVRFHNAGRHG